MIRVRRGSSEKDTIAVRWLHSLVSSMMPITGSSSAIEKFVEVRKLLYERKTSSCVTPTIIWMTMTAAQRTAVEISSHMPARVS